MPKREITVDDQPLLTIGQTCAMLQVSRSWLYVLIDRGDLERVKLGRKASRITRESLDRYIERKRAESRGEAEP